VGDLILFNRGEILPIVIANLKNDPEIADLEKQLADLEQEKQKRIKKRQLKKKIKELEKEKKIGSKIIKSFKDLWDSI